jgi:SAM-dependent methyltransferase
MSNQDNLVAEAWDERYRKASTPWDIGEPAPPFVDFLARPDAPVPGRTIVPGSGRGHDALYFARHGFEVLGVDIAPTAVNVANERAQSEGLSAKAIFEERDLLAMPPEFDGTFDYVVEHTCFCAIDPSLRPAYVQAVHRLLKPGGLLIAIFFAHPRDGGPPFRTDASEVRTLFSPYFQIEELAPAVRSHKSRVGEELFGLLRNS